jgi:hypothetical protein
MQGKIGKIGSAISAVKAGPAAPGGLAGLAAPGGLAGLAAPGGVPTSSAGITSALQGLPASSSGVTNALQDVAPISVAPAASSARVANEVPTSFAALKDSVKEAPARATRSVSPGIASRMKNFTSNAAVTPTGQATRGLFNTARTFGRARPDRGHGGLTRRVHR